MKAKIVTILASGCSLRMMQVELPTGYSKWVRISQEMYDILRACAVPTAQSKRKRK